MSMSLLCQNDFRDTTKCLSEVDIKSICGLGMNEDNHSLFVEVLAYICLKKSIYKR